MKPSKRKSKIKIGVVGENSMNDSEALITLLRKKAFENIDFQFITKKLKGSGLDGVKFFKLLEDEMVRFDKIIFIRDADGVLDEQILAKKHIRDEWFRKADKAIGGKGIFFLAIAEMEALILADINAFNTFYGTKQQFQGNPMMVEKPKETLKNWSDKSKKGKYHETHAPDIFEKLDFETVYKNHKGERSFQTFADELKAHEVINFEFTDKRIVKK
ncbi:MAG: hypothetical protein RLZZ628_766 [Bacteroidota bacterium]|jgi:hypothetical protein